MDGAFAPWHIIVLVIVLVVLFGARRLPGAAHSLGRSMHIFKRSISGDNFDPNDPNSFNSPDNNASSGFSASTSANTLPPSAPPSQPLQAGDDPTQTQLRDLQRQVEELQRQSAGGNAGQQNQPF